MPQVACLCARGLTACYVAGSLEDECVKERVRNGDYQLILFTPEMLLDQKRWRRMLLDDVYSTHLRPVVVDEAHTVKKWLVTAWVSFAVCICLMRMTESTDSL